LRQVLCREKWLDRNRTANRNPLLVPLGPPLEVIFGSEEQNNNEDSGTVEIGLSQHVINKKY
jgi:hypothetical protein